MVVVVMMMVEEEEDKRAQTDAEGASEPGLGGRFGRHRLWTVRKAGLRRMPVRDCGKLRLRLRLTGRGMRNQRSEQATMVGVVVDDASS